MTVVYQFYKKNTVPTLTFDCETYISETKEIKL